MGSVWNDSVNLSRLCIDQIKLLGFQDGLLFGLGTFGCDFLCYRWERGFKEPIYEDLVIKLDVTQTTTSPPLMDVVSYVGHSILAARQQDLHPFIISDGELEILQEHESQGVEFWVFGLW